MEFKSMVVVDESHIAAVDTLQKMCDLLDREIDEYLKLLDKVTTEAAKAGRTATRYKEYASIISPLKGQLEKLGNMLDLTINNFVSDIDAADSYLY